MKAAFVAALRRAWPVLLAYGAFFAWGFGCFVTSLALTSGGAAISRGGGVTLLGLVLAVGAGNVAGNLLGLARLRLAVVVAIFVGISIASAFLGAAALFGIAALFAAIGGYLGVASRVDIVASWFPLTLSVGAAIVWLNRHGAVSIFNQGNKHGIWDGFSLVCIAGAIFLNLVFLATRNALGLAIWQEVGRAGRRSTEGMGAARPGRGSLLVLLLFSGLVIAATALISPYLFRTTDSDGDGQQKEQRHDGERRRSKTSRGDGPEQGDARPAGDGQPDTDGAARAAGEALAMGMRALAWLVAIALALFVLFTILFAPLRRAFFLRHLERPIWPVSPTSRVINLWRRGLAALGVVGIAPLPGEAPRVFAHRASPELVREIGGDGEPLVRAAEIVERVDYEGRGLGADDERAMRYAVTVIVQAIDARAGFKRKVMAAWGPAPEIER